MAQACHSFCLLKIVCIERVTKGRFLEKEVPSVAFAEGLREVHVNSGRNSLDHMLRKGQSSAVKPSPPESCLLFLQIGVRVTDKDGKTTYNDNKEEIKGMMKHLKQSGTAYKLKSVFSACVATLSVPCV